MEKAEFEKLETLVKVAKKVASTEWEKAFCSEQLKRVKQYGERVMMSDKQKACLQKIIDKDAGNQADPEPDEVPM